jgi:WD40 repeat protein
VRFWSVSTGELLRTVEDPRTTVAMALSPDGRRLATGHREDGSIAIHDLSTGLISQTYPPPAK